jgi:hypothetical protein
MMDTRYTFVTVVFEQDYRLLLLQARSMRMYCPTDLLNEIIVIDNSTSGRIPSSVRNQLLIEYGHLRTFVHILPGSDIAQCPQAGGWFTQQVLKIMVARVVKSERYIVLDAKNHFVFPLNRHFLEDTNGLASMRFLRYNHHPLLNYLKRTFDYFGIDHGYIESFTQCTPPFIFFTGIVRQMISDVSTERRDVFENILIHNQITEFFSYTSYMLSRGIDLFTLYFPDQRLRPGLWEEDPTEEEATAQISNAKSGEFPIFGIQRGAIVKFDQKTMHRIAEFWYDRELFESTRAANRFLAQWRRWQIYYKWKYRFLRPARVIRRIVRTARQLCGS